MIGILDRFLVRETLKTLLAVVLVIVLILCAHALMRLLASVAAGLIAQNAMIRLIGLVLLESLGQLLPPAFFLAILFTLGRMYRDNEMTALLASGVSLRRVFRSFLLLALPLTLAVGWLTAEVLPWAKLQERQVRAVQEDTAKLSRAMAGQFTEFEKGGLLFYIEKVAPDGVTLSDIFVQHRQHGTLGLVRAARGTYVEDSSGDGFLVLSDGYRYEGTPGALDYTIGHFARYSMRVVQPEAQDSVQRNESTMTTAELLASDQLRARAELQYRLSPPLAVLVFTVLALPLSRSVPRQGMYGRLIMAFLVYFLFLNLMEISGTWMRAGLTPAWLGRWWVHALVLAGAGLLLAKDSSWWARWKRRRRLARAGK
jgi:lipopolysaccharide export system permease protein